MRRALLVFFSRLSHSAASRAKSCADFAGEIDGDSILITRFFVRPHLTFEFPMIEPRRIDTLSAIGARHHPSIWGAQHHFEMCVGHSDSNPQPASPRTQSSI
jgi:hypothetical protein